MPEVSFYILPSQTEQGRLDFACKLAEKAYRGGQFCYILTENEKQSKTLDDLLWTFRAGSFVPHQICMEPVTSPPNMILIGNREAPEQWQPIIINLSTRYPENLDHCKRLLEILDTNESIKSEGRKRYKRYQQAGLPIVTHKM